MKHDIDPRLDICRQCNLSVEAIYLLPVGECCGRELVTDARGFPVPIGSLRDAVDLLAPPAP